MENKDPLNPSLSVLVKLGSLVVHANEYLSAGGHQFDLSVFYSGLSDDEIREWLASMNALGFLPVRRNI